MGNVAGSTQTPVKAQFAEKNITSNAAYFPKKMVSAVIDIVDAHCKSEGSGISFPDLCTAAGLPDNAASKGYLGMLVALTPELESQRGVGGGVITAGFEPKGGPRAVSVVEVDAETVTAVCAVASELAPKYAAAKRKMNLTNLGAVLLDRGIAATPKVVSTALALSGFTFEKNGSLSLPENATPRTTEQVRELFESMKHTPAA